MTELDMKIEELENFISDSEKKIESLKSKLIEAKKSIKKLERIKAEIAEIVI